MTTTARANDVSTMGPQERLRALAAAHYPPKRANIWRANIDITKVAIRERTNLRLRGPMSYSSEEQQALEEWRRCALLHIDGRIANYQRRPARSNIPSVPTRMDASRGHRVLRIPELLDMILQFAGPEAQVSAWNVSRVWRRSSKSVISSRHRHSYWQAYPFNIPVEYASLVTTPYTAWCEPTQDELDNFAQIFSHLTQRVENGRTNYIPTTVSVRLRGKLLYLPARYTQYPSLPSAIVSALVDLHEDQKVTFNSVFLHQHSEPVSALGRTYWLDFSQFNINPYFSALFGQRSKVKMGRIEIALRSGSSSVDSLFELCVTQGLLDLLGPMFISQPPCRVIGLYQTRKTKRGFNDDLDDFEFSNKHLLVRVRNDNGVKVGDVVEALRKHTPEVISSWFDSASELRSLVSSGHWVDDIWHTPGTPRFFLLLDNAVMSQEWMDEGGLHDQIAHDSSELLGRYDPAMVQIPIAFRGHDTRPVYLTATGFREERQGEWMPRDAMEPAQSISSIRFPINWNR